jgi:hypothetical protein
MGLAALLTAGCSLFGVGDASGLDSALVLPLRVHLVASKIHDLDAASIVTDGAVKDRMKHINRIFEPAGIQFELESIRRDRAADTGPFRRAAKGEPKQRALTALVNPSDLIAPKGLDLYVLRDLSPVKKGGAYRCTVRSDGTGPGAAFIAARSAKDGIQPLRKWAHELGHALNLGHVPCETRWSDNLMMSGKCEHGEASRSALTAEQVTRLKAQARQGKPAACRRDRAPSED